MTLSDILSKHRIYHYEVADHVGVHRIMVGRWASGESAPSSRKLPALVEYLRRFEPDLDATEFVRASWPEEAA